MEGFHLDRHNEKITEFARKAASGTYPSPKIAKAGSYMGVAIGAALSVAGGVGLMAGSVWGLGCILAGLVAVISNTVNIVRINNDTAP